MQQPRARSNSQLRATTSQSALQTPVRRGEAGQQRPFTPRATATVGRSAGALSRAYTPQSRPPSLLSTPHQSQSQNQTQNQNQHQYQFQYQYQHQSQGQGQSRQAAAAGTSALRRGRRLSEAGVGGGSAAWRGELFPGLPAPSPASSQPQTSGQQPLFSSSIVRSHTVADPFQTPTAHNERRPESRGSTYSAASGHAFLGTPSSGKQPVLVRSVRLDLKVVPPALDAAKARRKEAARGEDRKHSQPDLQNQQQQQLVRSKAARVRVRMDVSAHVLHAGEQRVDLLSVAEPYMLQRSRSDRRGQARSDYGGGDGYCWPVVERTACAVAGSPAVGDYAESAASPLVSPVQPPAALDETPVPARKAAAGESDRLSLSIRRSDQKPRPQSMFHIDEVSPYPPAPCTPSPPLTQTRELPEGASRYETHTLSSFARAQARVSDRIALYNELSQASTRTQGAQSGGLRADARRTQSFGAEANSAMSGLGLSMGLGLDPRPVSALERSIPAASSDMPLRNELLVRAANAPERPRSAMGLMSPVQQQSRSRRRRRASSVASTATRDGVDMSPSVGSCVFEVDRVRGTLFARLSECRRYRLTVWFSVSASADALPAAGVDFWESGSVAISGIPRSLNTRVRVRLPHRLPMDADDLLASATTGSCFYSVRMVQPPRVEPQSSRAVDAHAASSSVSHRRAVPLLPPSSLLFSPASPALPAQFPGAAGWLLTDDSDADADAEAESADMVLASRSNTGETDRETDVNRKLMGFLMESRRRNSLSLDGPRPWLVGDPEDAVVGNFSDDDDDDDDKAGDKAGDSERHGFWKQFAAQNHGFDFARTELTAFKLRLAESVTLAWSPRADPSAASAYRRSIAQADRPFELSPLLSQETMPLEQQQQLLPEMPAVRDAYLETIFSAEPTPVIDAPAEPIIAFSPVAKPAAVATTSLVCLHSVDACLDVRPGGLALSTTVRVEREQGQADFCWPAFVDLDFSPLLVAIGAVRNMELHHQSVSVDGSRARWVSGSSAVDAALDGSAFSNSPMAPSRLRVWIPALDAAATAFAITVESAPALRIEFSGMALTKSFFVAVPMNRLVSMASSPALSEIAEKSSAAITAAVRVANAADMWVNAVQSDSKGMDVGALSLMPQDSSAIYQVVSIERKVSPIAASFSQRLAAAYDDNSATGADSQDKAQLIFATALGIAVDIEHGGIRGAEETDISDKLVVRVAVSCSLATFSPWRSQLARPSAHDDQPSSAMQFLAMAVPNACGAHSKWELESLEFALAAGQGRSKAPVQAVVELDDGLIAIPLSQRSCFSTGSTDVLCPEVTIDSITCLFSCSIAVSELEHWPCLWLPAPHLARPAATHSSIDAVFARASSALLDSASVTVSSASSGAAIRVLKGKEVEQEGIAGTCIECAVDADPDKPLVAQKLQIALSDIHKLCICLRPLPAPKTVEYATKATDTDDLLPAATKDVESAQAIAVEPKDSTAVVAPETPGEVDASAEECHSKPDAEEDTDELDDTAAVSCISSSPTSASASSSCPMPLPLTLASPLQLPASAEPSAAAQPAAFAAEDSDGFYDDLMSVRTPASAPSVVSNASVGSGRSRASGSLRNRHVSRTRAAAERAVASSVVGISLHPSSIIHTETEPLLGSSAAAAAVGHAAGSEREPQSLASRAWRGLVWVLSIVVFVVVTFTVLSLLSGDVFDSLSADDGGVYVHQPRVLPSISLPDHQTASSAEPAILFEPTASAEEDNRLVVGPGSAGRSRVFIRGKSSDIYELLISEHLEDAEDPAIEVTNDGVHSFNTTAAETSSSLLAIIYRLVIEPLLGIMNTTT
ncbi:hypothetical protein LPJ56_001388 [Coemansia sp. RSA 2599]|nr:hypothetical protein LPJ56_001388 [Coemansia sp. RSA 2599]